MNIIYKRMCLCAYETWLLIELQSCVTTQPFDKIVTTFWYYIVQQPCFSIAQCVPVIRFLIWWIVKVNPICMKTDACSQDYLCTCYSIDA